MESIKKLQLLSESCKKHTHNCFFYIKFFNIPSQQSFKKYEESKNQFKILNEPQSVSGTTLNTIMPGEFIQS